MPYVYAPQDIITECDRWRLLMGHCLRDAGVPLEEVYHLPRCPADVHGDGIVIGYYAADQRPAARDPAAAEAEQVARLKALEGLGIRLRAALNERRQDGRVDA